MKAAVGYAVAFVAQWQDLEKSLLSSQQRQPVIVDSALFPEKPNYSNERPTLFRERHGWCPYSERVWLALETTNIEYDTIRIDNTGPGRKPPYWRGNTPQMRWPDGSNQGESMDLVEEIDKRYCNNLLYPNDIKNEVINKAREFQNIFPSGSRPSSRAAFLFGWSGEPLFKSEFESTLSKTNELLSKGGGPFFCGEEMTAADIAWVPFLERYAAQLPCLHEGLNPRDPKLYPSLNKWFDAMESIPAYACRVRGNPSSWRKVLTMAGYGNGGAPPDVVGRIDALQIQESCAQSEEDRIKNQALWDEYRSTRLYLAKTPSAEVGRILLSNRNAIVTDTLKRASSLEGTGLPLDEDGLDASMRALATLLIYGSEDDGHYDDLAVASKEGADVDGVFELAKFLDERMCVPRDMGAMSADCIKRLSVN